MSFWNDLLQTISAKIQQLVDTGESSLTPEEYKELFAKEYASMLTKEREVYERDVVLVSRKMRHVHDDEGNIVKNPFTGTPLEVPTKDLCIDLVETRAELVEGLAEGYVTDVDVNGADVTTTWGDGNTKTQTVTKVGNATVGSGTNHIYLNAGTPTASTSTVGGTARPMYLNSGVMTACSASVGDASTPVYVNNGTITACSSGLGGGMALYVITGYTYTHDSGGVNSSPSRYTVRYTTRSGDFKIPSGDTIAIARTDSNLGSTTLSSVNWNQDVINVYIDGVSCGSLTINHSTSYLIDSISLLGTPVIEYCNSYCYNRNIVQYTEYVNPEPGGE